MPTPAHVAISKALEKIVKPKKVPLTSVALAYVMHKAPSVFPVLGGGKVRAICGDNVDTLGLALSEEDIAAIDASTDFGIGFPLNFLTLKKDPGHLVGLGENVDVQNFGGHHEYVEPVKPIVPKQQWIGKSIPAVTRIHTFVCSPF